MNNGEAISSGYNSFVSEQAELFLICALSFLAGAFLVWMVWGLTLGRRRR